MMRILLLYASSYGQTQKIAERLAARWRARGYEVEVRPAGGSPPAPTGFAALILGSRLAVWYAGSIRRYVKRHRAGLEGIVSGFFSVSASAASPDPRGPAGVDARIQQFLAGMRWSPLHVASFAGALPYTRYDPVTRFVMKRICASVGLTTDTSRDHELTDWAKVDEFAERVADSLRAPGTRTA